MNENSVLSTEIDEEELVIGRWGRAGGSQLRCRFMQDCYPKEAAKLEKTERWEQLALEIEREALDFWQLLRMQRRLRYSRTNNCKSASYGRFYGNSQCGSEIASDFLTRAASM